jgi:hypothetical protein
MGEIIVAKAMNRKLFNQGNAPTIQGNKCLDVMLLVPMPCRPDRADNAGTKANEY